MNDITINPCFPKPLAILFRTSQDASNEAIRESIEFACTRYSMNPQEVFSGELKVQVAAFIDRKSLQCDPKSFLSRNSLEEFGNLFSDQFRGVGRVILRCFITDDMGNGRHEIGIVWSKRNASYVQQVIRDCEPWALLKESVSQEQ